MGVTARALACLALSVGCSILSGFALEISWVEGGLALICTGGVGFWSGYAIEKAQNRHHTPATALFIYTIAMMLAGLASVASAIYFPVALLSLNIFVLASIPGHLVLYCNQWMKIARHPGGIVTGGTMLMTCGVVITGRSLSYGGSFTLPGVIAIVHATILLSKGLCKDKYIEINRLSITLLVILLSSIISSFLTHFFASGWTPVPVITVICTLPFFIYAEKRSDLLYVEHGSFYAVLHLVIATATGVSVAAKMSISSSSSFHNFAISAGHEVSATLRQAKYPTIVTHYQIRQSFQEINRTPAVKRPILLFVSLVTSVVLIVALLITYQVLRLTTPFLIPFIFIGLAALTLLPIYITSSFRAQYKHFGAASGVLIALTSYLVFIVLILAISPEPHLFFKTTFPEELGMHIAALVVSSALTLHCALIADWRSKQAEKSKRHGHQQAASPEFDCLVGPIAALSLLYGCCLITGAAFSISWMAGMPMLLVFFATCYWACVCLKGCDKKTHRLVAITSFILLISSTTLSFFTYFYALHLCAAPILCTLASVLILFFAELNTSGFHTGFIRVLVVLQLLAAAAAGVTITAGMHVAFLIVCASLLLIATMIMSGHLCIIHYLNVKNRRESPDVKHSKLMFCTLPIIVVLLGTVLFAFHSILKYIPALVPLILVGVTSLYLIAIYIIYQLRDKIKCHGRIGFLLLVLTIYIWVIFAKKFTIANELWKTGLIGLIVISALTFHCIFFSIMLLKIYWNRHFGPRRPMYVPPPAAAAAAAPPVAVVVERDVDSDYESVDGDDV